MKKEKACSKCGQQPIATSGMCAPCWNQYMREYRKANPPKLSEKSRAARREYNRQYQRDYRARNAATLRPQATEAQKLHKYKLTKEQLSEMKERQGGMCAICGKQERLSIDHDHDTKKVRELLCHNCNVALGHAKEDTGILAAMIAYLEKWKIA